MISAKELYRKIKAKYPDFQPPEHVPEVPYRGETIEEENKWIEERFECSITTPVLDEQQLDLLEMGFPVKANRDPRFYKDRYDPEETDRFIQRVNRKYKIKATQ